MSGMQRDRWPWIAGRNELIRLIAARHHDVISVLREIPAALAGIDVLTDRGKGPSWSELLDAGFRALETVGREVATARSHEQVEAARLRHETYQRQFEEMVGTLLSIAHRYLMVHPKDGAFLVGYGRSSVGAPLDAIPPEDWEVGTPDWNAWRLALPEGMAFHGVRLACLDDADDAVLRAILAEFATCGGGKGRPVRRGRDPAQEPLISRGAAWKEELDRRPAGTTMRAAAEKIAKREGLDPATVEREARRARASREQPKRGEWAGKTEEFPRR